MLLLLLYIKNGHNYLIIQPIYLQQFLDHLTKEENGAFLLSIQFLLLDNNLII